MKLRLFRLMLCTHEGSTNICTRTDLFRFFHAKIHYKRHNGENNRTSCVFGAVLAGLGLLFFSPRHPQMLVGPRMNLYVKNIENEWVNLSWNPSTGIRNREVANLGPCDPGHAYIYKIPLFKLSSVSRYKCMTKIYIYI